MANVIFQSERVDFTPLSEALMDDYLTMVNDPGVQRMITHVPRVYEPVGELQWIRENLADNRPIFSMIERATGAFIGNIELCDFADGGATLGVSVTPAMQNRGFGTEAIRRILAFGFETLGLEFVRLNVYSFNPRARHVYEKLGFVATDFRENAAEADGAPSLDIQMRLDRRDFYKSSLA